ncbi:MAG: PIN domain-containing protein [Dehalococcoidia bacterium]
MIIIDTLNGVAPAESALDPFEHVYISVVTWVEVMAGVRGPAERARAEVLLSGFQVVSLDSAIARIAATIRQELRLKLPNAAILATARHLGVPLLTRNTKDFDPADPAIVVPYTL